MRAAAQKQPIGVVAVAKRVADAVKRRAIRKREKSGATPAHAAPTTRCGQGRIAQPRVDRAAVPSRRRPWWKQPSPARRPEELSAHKFDVTPALTAADPGFP